ncbi:KHNYN-like [Solea senegalensis]|uniref:KHNYN-like n=1 Tax=Solea senegalensis TaxID=28829 RepID=A0AAV6QVF4_SOLSE|nr:protein KHNYN [Solea senegalensis]XP_043877454.1 protein KHNYN [Solea senegalensis]KAG7496303.1 KHNYN-like [Solea senegalensis]
MDGERSDRGGGDDEPPEVEDEFACAGILRGSLTSLHDSVERIFRVTFGIGADDLPHGNNGQIWLKLRGSSNDVKAAKLFVKGVVNQEEQQEVSYPGVLHCVFCGARGLFMDSLIKTTSAHIMVGSSGFLLISGLVEPVVRAYSLISELVERHATGDRGSGETLESRRAFKSLVEKWEDRHILDLLLLPGSVMEILLDLVKESGLGSSPSLVKTEGNVRVRDGSEEIRDKPSTIKHTDPEPSSTVGLFEGMTAGSGKDAASMDSVQSLSASYGARGRAEGTEERLMHSPEEVGEEGHPAQKDVLGTKEEEGDEEERQSSTGYKEFWLLLKFFTAMGYTEDVVKRVLAQTGPREASQILDLVQQEQDRSDKKQMLQGGHHPKHNTQNVSEKNRPCENREDEVATAAGQDSVMSSNGEVHERKEGGAIACIGRSEGGSLEEKDEGHEEDFVLGVLKKAAASCGYTEQEVAKVYKMLPDRSTHQLLLELQREGSSKMDVFREGPREIDDVVLEKNGPIVVPAGYREKSKPDDEGWVEVPIVTAPITELDLFPWIVKPQQPPVHQTTLQPKQHWPSETQTQHPIVPPEVKGPPMATYPSTLDPPLTKIQTNTDQNIFWPDPATSKHNHSTHDNIMHPKPSNAVNQGGKGPGFTRNSSSPTRARERQGFMPASSVVVTGEQRFLEGLLTPFDLQLTDKPGVPKLRTIIIDGSNVAMSHGLGHFFSCRGIALAVQHFWDRGHRDISVLLPQWRQKSDPKIKEQHYLTELQTIGLLSYTPSREVQGKRISSYDDRFMLQLAQKTGGVIVTNDNLRDLSDESTLWRDIIKKRLLQYTFVGNHFMVPDDPLGRGGPHLDDFLRSEHGSPDPGNHSFAGVATSFPSSKPPRSMTEGLNFRDRTPGSGAAGRGGRGTGRGQGKAARRWTQESRSPEETLSLREQLCLVFPGQDNEVTLVLQCHPAETDINVLSDQILELQKV